MASFKKYIRDPALYAKKYTHLPNCVLLYGPHGNGKTVLARDIALDVVTLVEVDCGNWQVGDGEFELNRALDKAKENEPCVLLLDNVEGAGLVFSGLSSCPGLLKKWEKVVENENILVVGTCPTTIHEAIAKVLNKVFLTKIMIGYPDNIDRKAIIEYYLNVFKISCENIENLVTFTDGFSCEEIETLVHRLYLTAKEEMIEVIKNEQIETIFEANYKGNSIRLRKRIYNIYEAGIILAKSMLTPKKMGYTLVPSRFDIFSDDKFFEEYNDLETTIDKENEVKILLAGRIAQRILLKKTYTFSQTDVLHAYKIVEDLTKFVGAYGYEYMTNDGTDECFFPKPTILTDLQARKINEKINEFDKDIEKKFYENLDLLKGIVELLNSQKTITKKDIVLLGRKLDDGVVL